MKRRRRVLTGVLVVYLLALLYFLFLAEWYRRAPSQAVRFNFVPFAEIRRFWLYRETLGIAGAANLFGNILGFIPLGILLPSLLPRFRKAVLTVGTGMMLSAAVEAAQYLTRVGICDIDDVILNTAGAAAGYAVYYLRKRRRDRGRP